jgi:Right handed beta helix region
VRATKAHAVLLAALAAATIAALMLTAAADAATVRVTTTADGGAGSLREAIDDANALGGPDTIRFDIPGQGPHTIAPASDLPAVTDPVTINGFSQPAPQGIIAILIGLANAPGGLTLETDDSVVRGLELRSAPGDALRIAGDGNQIENNRIAFSGGDGIRVESGVGNALLHNETFANGDLGIDLNDSTGANNLQARPHLISSNNVGTATVVDWRLDSAPSTRYRIDFYGTGACGNGQTFLGSTTAETNANGRVAGSTDVAVFPVDGLVTATATVATGTTDTSELSPCVIISQGVRR